jgi:hypothetical protein
VIHINITFNREKLIDNLQHSVNATLVLGILEKIPVSRKGSSVTLGYISNSPASVGTEIASNNTTLAVSLHAGLLYLGA